MVRKPESSAQLGRVELELLQFLDAHPGASVAEAAEQFGGPRQLARTTVLTMMTRLVAKGYLTRQQIDSVYRYHLKISARQAVSQLVSDFVRTVLGGSVSPFVAYLNDANNLSAADVDELRQIVRDWEQRPESPPAPDQASRSASRKTSRRKGGDQ